MLRKARVTYLVVNGDESEPATFKDHLLIERDPHQIIEGTIIAAYAIGVAAGVHLLPGRVRPRPRAAPARPATRPTRTARSGSDIFGSEFSLDLVIHPGAGAYICGEETALLESLEGKRGFPRIKPPYFPAAIGLYGEPTVVNNVETVSNLPWIVENGGEAFAALGAGLLDRHAAVRPLRSRRTPRLVRARDVEDDLPRPHLRPVARRRHRRRQGAEGVHPRRRLGAVVRSRAPRPRARPGRGRQGRLDARLRLGRRHGRDHLRGAGRVAHHALLPPRVLRAVHAVPGGRAAGSRRSCAASSRATGARRTSTS